MNSKRAGFTLIEVVIAVAIFALAAVQLSSAFTYALLARERSVNSDVRNDDIRAVRLQLLLEPSLEDAEEGGAYDTLNNGEGIWRSEIEPMEVVDLFKVNFIIEFSEPMEGEASTYAETLYLLRPTWSESSERSDLLEDKKQALLDSRDFDSF